jgi:arylsulfatase
MDTETPGLAVVEDDQDDLGLRLRTLVTERYRMTVYAGQTYGELFDLREDPDEVRNLWGDAGRRDVQNELVATLLDTIVATDHALPRRMGTS